jgi:hypothetical protein
MRRWMSSRYRWLTRGPQTAHPASVAQSTLRRQIPEVEAVCGKTARTALCRGVTPCPCTIKPDAFEPAVYKAAAVFQFPAFVQPARKPSPGFVRYNSSRYGPDQTIQIFRKRGTENAF